MSKSMPVCLTFDNVNWVDSSSAEIISDLMSIGEANILCLFSTRDKSLPKELSGCNINLHHELTMLSDESSLKLISSLVSLEDDVAQRIVEKTRGNPLFIHELSQCIGINDGALPDSIYDVIMVKLDRLQLDERLFLTNAAVIGQVFDVRVLEGIGLAKERLLHES